MRILSSIFVTMIASQAAAICTPQEETFMSCTFQQGRKAVDVCVNGSEVRYWFGPVGGRAELAMSLPVRDVFYVPWKGAGSTVYEVVSFPNNAVAYEVYGSFDRVPTAERQLASMQGGINIFENDALLATLSCDAGSVYFPWTDALSR